MQKNMFWLGPVSAPPRETIFGVTVTAVSFALLVAMPLSAHLQNPHDLASFSMVGGPVVGWALLAASTMALFGGRAFAKPPARGLALLVATFAFVVAASPWIRSIMSTEPFVVLYLVAPVVFLAVVVGDPGYRGAFEWMRVGIIGFRLAAVLIGLAVVGVLGVTMYASHQDLSHQPLMRTQILHGAWLVVAGFGVAAFNAAIEEAAYRGVLMNALDAAFGAGILSVVAQAAAFGAFHFNSTEPGLTGVALTTVLGLTLGILRRVGRGMMAPYLLHVSLDIAVWLAGWAQAH